MKKALLFTVLFLSMSWATHALKIPKKIIGQYQAEVPDFDFEDNGRTVHASGYTLSLILKEEFMLYKSGILELQGSYKSLSENGGLIDLAVEISDNVAIEFDLGLTIDKKTGSIAVSGLKGLPEITLHKKEIQVEKNNRGFKRL